MRLSCHLIVPPVDLLAKPDPMREATLARARLTGGIAGVARGLLLFLCQLFALLASCATFGVDLLLGGQLGCQSSGFLLGLFTTQFRLGQFVLLAKRFLLSRSLGGKLVKLRVRCGGLGLELCQEGLLGLLLSGDTVVEAGLFQISHA